MNFSSTLPARMNLVAASILSVGPRAVLAVLFGSVLTACGGGGGGGLSLPSNTLPITVTASAVEARAGDNSLTLTAQNPNANTTVSWSLQAGSPGSLDSTSGNIVHYLPPPTGSLSEDATVNIVASVGQATQTINVKLRPSAGVYLIAGLIGGPGTLDGTGSAARFYSTQGMTRDAQGNLFVLDGDYPYRVRKITPGGVVTTVAILPAITQDLGIQRITVAADGMLYLHNTFGIYRITPAGDFSFFAGGNLYQNGYADGSGSAARFNNIVDMVVDAEGNLLVLDVYNYVIRKVSPSGMVTTFAGTPKVQGSSNGPASQASFKSLSAITQDAAGNAYVLDGSTLRKISSSGIVSSVAVWDFSKIGNIVGMTIDAAGNFFVAGSLGNQNLVQKISADGTVTKLAGGENNADYTLRYVDGAGAQARFGNLTGIAVDNAGNQFVADINNHVIRKISTTASGGVVVSTFAGTSENGPHAFSVGGTGSAAAFFDSGPLRSDAAGNIFVLDHALYKVAPGGVVSIVPVSGGTIGYTYLHGIPNFALANDGSFLVSTAVGIIYRVTASGGVTEFAGQNKCYSAVGPCGGTYIDGTGSAAQFNGLEGVASDGNGNTYVIDGDLLRKISSAAEVSSLFTLATNRNTGLNTGKYSDFIQVRALAVDPDGSFYVTDRSSVNKVSKEGKMTLIAGLSGIPGVGGMWGFQDGIGTEARFASPSDIVRDTDGTLYVADTGNNAIRKIDTNGKVTTVAGGTGDGNLTGALPGALLRPKGIAIIAPKTLAVSVKGAVLKVLLQ